ncbi:hypothetical protein EMIHUDRAFT_256810, partial [Emiliania huxleyi CCMP1516]|uniref:Mnd1 HTH domain-containing protein n=2 Tax=Emiliania huxleyi TaxID=2903 RepID=A0A0D3IQ93_EMIH1
MSACSRLSAQLCPPRGIFWPLEFIELSSRKDDSSDAHSDHLPPSHVVAQAHSRFEHLYLHRDDVGAGVPFGCIVTADDEIATGVSSSSGKRGVSADEKKQRMLGMFHASRAVYTMKDIERDAPKLGIISNAVKDVLKELVCDDLVHEEK